jgi:hypothetical protein
LVMGLLTDASFGVEGFLRRACIQACARPGFPRRPGPTPPVVLKVADEAAHDEVEGQVLGLAVGQGPMTLLVGGKQTLPYRLKLGMSLRTQTDHLVFLPHERCSWPGLTRCKASAS